LAILIAIFYFKTMKHALSKDLTITSKEPKEHFCPLS